MLCERFKTSDARSAVLTFRDLQSLRIKGDNLQAFDLDWDVTLTGMKSVPTEDILLILYRDQVAKAKHFQERLRLNDLVRGDKPETYEGLRQPPAKPGPAHDG